MSKSIHLEKTVFDFSTKLRQVFTFLIPFKSKGSLNMADIYEDPSFLIFASIRKGYSFSRALKSAVATVHGPNAIQQSVSLRDDGLCTCIPICLKQISRNK
jgi:hypothetical protein